MIKIRFLGIRVTAFDYLLTGSYKKLPSLPSGDFQSFWDDEALRLLAQLCVSSLLHQWVWAWIPFFWHNNPNPSHLGSVSLPECLSPTLYIVSPILATHIYLLFPHAVTLRHLETTHNCFSYEKPSLAPMPLPDPKNFYFLCCNAVTLHLYHKYCTLI